MAIPFNPSPSYPRSVSLDDPSFLDNELLELELEPKPIPPSRPPTSSRRPLPPPSSRPPRVVADLMTRKLIAAKESDGLANIEVAMKQYRFRHLPVVDDQNHVIGLLTHRDMLHIMSSSLSSDRQRRDRFIHARATVGGVMRRDLHTAHASEALTVAAERMWKHKIGCLPVVDADGTLVGIVTEADFLKLSMKLLRAANASPTSNKPRANPAGASADPAPNLGADEAFSRE